MRRTLIAATATLALLSGAAFAQTTSPTVANPSSSTSSMSNTATPDSAATTGSATTGSTLGAGQMASADQLLGKNVYGRDNDKLGEVDDVILDSNGQAKQLVIGSGGFLGIGEKKVAVDYTAANWDAQNNRLNMSGLSRDDVKAMPEFKYDDTMTSLNRTRKPADGTTTGTTIAK
ncbi:sporulation protein YlmC with PRC-barrel domain [Azospirillum agricola]|uniref:PRC-barrel domain-containing protein n=1 Tax=Azospirillum agricola TaxID=1720247 RepID=UPI001AE7869C|nr:PRC-barrel domain-containing protein [Azospirillum agricola]MBP2230641.1 sporulation protein YlmC with PRC-barrel domain [Azospirillum agricola]